MIVKQLSGIGTRQVNEDSVGYTVNEGMFCGIVCDGLGGHAAGEVASRIVRNSILADFSDNPTIDENSIGQYIWNAQKKLVKEKYDNPVMKDMMTTVSLIVTDGAHILVGHVGDTRILLYGKKALLFRSKDHSIIQRMVENNEITETESLHHPDRNKLTRVIGMNWEIDMFEIKKFSIHQNEIDYAVLCSDGFWENFDEVELGKALYSSKDYGKLLNKIELRIAKSKYFGDNYSALLIAFE
ncbi:MAG: hypothetical protein CVU98_07140 [Firmicutes bacterium HGW-Firmicutes-3]|jgi:serine/threonine protein phosphatase PrpC|nr:MAG: hypothetical protein CVU98_07140 [Firmicutes bacterium HGW-Firmicutes-3]